MNVPSTHRQYSNSCHNSHHQTRSHTCMYKIHVRPYKHHGHTDLTDIRLFQPHRFHRCSQYHKHTNNRSCHQHNAEVKRTDWNCTHRYRWCNCCQCNRHHSHTCKTRNCQHRRHGHTMQLGIHLFLKNSQRPCSQFHKYKCTH